MDRERIIPVAIEEELKESYLTYAMSVIVSRALPDVRDGLKPVHRRILYVLSDMRLDYSAKTRKCAQIVGEVMGKYHPHGDGAIYDTLVRMAQDFSLRYPLVFGQGNFGSIDGDPPAAYRYTEAKMSKLAESMLRDIRDETVDFIPTYDGSQEEPVVLPAALPNLLINGSAGIAVGMATNMAPHNLREVCAAILATIDDPEITINELLGYVHGPDFPTRAVIHGRSGYRSAAFTGRGRVVVRARTTIEKVHGEKDAIVVTELPYMVNRKNLIEHMVELVKDKKIESISDIRNESGRETRIVVELKRGAQAAVTLNQLFEHTELQSAFNINNLALVNGQPRTLNLKELIVYFIAHRKEVIVRRSQYRLRKRREREHILKGLIIALENIDAVVEIIKASPNAATAKERLAERFGLSDIQTQAILDMRLQRLTGLETQKILDELAEILKDIAYLEDLLAHEEKIYALIKEETTIISNDYGNDRASEIVLDEIDGIQTEDLIEREEMVAIISKKGFIKRVALSEYREQARGGKGSLSTKLDDEDYVEHIFTGNTHDVLFFVTTKGRGYWLKVYQVPEGSRAGKGKHLRTIFDFEEDEEITETVCFSDFNQEQYLFMATKNGIVKRVELKAFSHAKTRGIIAISLDDGDALRRAEVTSGNDNILLVSKCGKALRFNEREVRSVGRSSRGVRGIRLSKEDELIGVCVEKEGSKVFILSEKGYGKRTNFEFFTPHGRGTGGQRIINTSGRVGQVLAANTCEEDKSLLVITTNGKTIKTALSFIPTLGRNAGGVRVVNLEEGDNAVGIAIVARNVEPEADNTMQGDDYNQADLFAAGEPDFNDNPD